MCAAHNYCTIIKNLWVIIWWIYTAGLHSSAWQATVGKKAMGIKVVDESGNRITFATATKRYFAEFLSALILMIGYVLIGFTKKRQSLHDIIAHTCVIYSNGPANRPTQTANGSAQ